MNLEADPELSVRSFKGKGFPESEDVLSFWDKKRTEFNFKL